MPILLVRHGNTTYDKKVDAILNPPLTREGVERLKRTAEFLKNFKITRIVSSPLQRALLAGEIISGGNIRVTTHRDALPWHLGDYMGKDQSIVEDKVKHLENYPSLAAPHGEAYNDFLTRWGRLLYTLMDYSDSRPDDEYILVACHSRNIDAIAKLIGGEFQDEKTPEGSVTLLARNGVNGWEHKRIWEGN